jgi:signal transduction histidine kinase
MGSSGVFLTLKAPFNPSNLMQFLLIIKFKYCMFRIFNFSKFLQSLTLRVFLIIGGLFIVIYSVYYTLNVAEQLKVEERRGMEQIAEAQMSMMTIDPACDITFQSKIIEGNKNVPMILIDGDNNILDVKNYGYDLIKDKAFFQKELAALRRETKPVLIESKEFSIKNYIYYRQSNLISYLLWFPYIQFGLLFLFIALAYLSFSALRRSQQERIWVGMAKETAHQLGTPLTSLIAWIENLRSMYPDDNNIQMISDEMYLDLEMLEIVAGRFSKIGAKPELSLHNIYDRLQKHYNYIRQRAPRKVTFDFPDPYTHQELDVNINPLLFDWVIENLLKNALDAMDGKGQIKVEVSENQKFVFIDVSDTGKGMPKSLFYKVFKPGFSTKKRGWGLGLSLCKRIVTNYHSGKIFVKQSVINQGTTFRIQLPKKL